MRKYSVSLDSVSLSQFVCLFLCMFLFLFFFFLFFLRFCSKPSWRKIMWNINLEEKSKSSHISGNAPFSVKH